MSWFKIFKRGISMDFNTTIRREPIKKGSLRSNITYVFAAALGVAVVVGFLGEEPVDLVTPDKTITSMQLVEVPAHLTYEGGPVAFVDYSVDKTFGECVIVWSPEHGGNFSNCADAEWQMLYPRRVPAGTGSWEVMTFWNDTYAPSNWS